MFNAKLSQNGDYKDASNAWLTIRSNSKYLRVSCQNTRTEQWLRKLRRNVVHRMHVHMSTNFLRKMVQNQYSNSWE
jgi:hypothetical protein